MLILRRTFCQLDIRRERVFAGIEFKKWRRQSLRVDPFHIKVLVDIEKCEGLIWVRQVYWHQQA